MTNHAVHSPASSQHAPLFKVLKGNPDAQQLAALTTLFGSMSAEAKRAQIGRPRNHWGRAQDQLPTQQVVNPAAFR